MIISRCFDESCSLTLALTVFDIKNANQFTSPKYLAYSNSNWHNKPTFKHLSQPTSMQLETKHFIHKDMADMAAMQAVDHLQAQAEVLDLMVV